MLENATSALWVIVIGGTLLIGGFALGVWFWGASQGETPEQRQARLSSVFDILKYLLGFVAVSVLGTALAESIKQREVALKERAESTNETQEAGKFLQYALALDGNTRLHFADFFAHVIRDKEYRIQREKYRDDLKGDIEKEAKITSETRELQSKLSARDLSPQDKSKIEAQLTDKTAELRLAKAALAPLVGSSPTTLASNVEVLPILKFFVGTKDQKEDIEKRYGELSEAGFAPSATEINEIANKADRNKLVFFNDADVFRAESVATKLRGLLSLDQISLEYSPTRKESRGYFEVVIKPRG